MPKALPVGSKRIKLGYVIIKVAPGKWQQEHRFVWEQAHGPIPDGYVIHHINHIKADNRLENLELCSSLADHKIKHHKTDPTDWLRAYWTGRKQSPEHRAKRSAALTGRKREPFSEEWKHKLGDATRGKPLSSEHRKRISDALKGKPKGQEHVTNWKKSMGYHDKNE